MSSLGMKYGPWICLSSFFSAPPCWSFVYGVRSKAVAPGDVVRIQDQHAQCGIGVIRGSTESVRPSSVGADRLSGLQSRAMVAWSSDSPSSMSSNPSSSNILMLPTCQHPRARTRPPRTSGRRYGRWVIAAATRRASPPFPCAGTGSPCRSSMRRSSRGWDAGGRS